MLPSDQGPLWTVPAPTRMTSVAQQQQHPVVLDALRHLHLAYRPGVPIAWARELRPVT
jgi:hypothetical protein